MKIRNNLGSFYSTLGKSSTQNISPYKIGRVYHVVTNENSSGYTDQSSIGTVYVLDYTAPKPNIELTADEQLSNRDLVSAGLTRAKPLFPQFSYIPLLDEFIILMDLPNANSDEADKSDLYYLNTINIWSNSHHNSQGIYNLIDDEGGIKLGDYVKPSSQIANLLPLEGDFIISSRWGSGIRFSSTPDLSLFNEPPSTPWEEASPSDSGSPITLIVNGYNPEDSVLPYIENVTRDDSSIYLTSTQYLSSSSFSPNTLIDKKPESFFPPLISPEKYGGINTSDENNSYNNSQIIVSSGRVTLNSSTNDIVLYSATNIEMGSNNTIHLNSQENVYLNSKNVYLGKIKDNDLGNVEPLILGYQTKQLINDMLSSLIELTENLKTLSVTDPKYLGTSISVFASGTNEKLEKLTKRVNNLLSKTTFTS